MKIKDENLNGFADGSNKPVLLVFPFGYLAHYLRCVVLARYFAHYYNILFASHSSYNKFVEKEGLGTFHCESMDEAEVLKKVRKFDFSWLAEKDLENVFLSQVAAIKTYTPAAVLGDAYPTLRMATKKTAVPYISLMNGYMSRYYAGVRSLSRTHPIFPLVSQLPAHIRDAATIKGESIAFKKVHEPFRKLRKKYKLATCSTYLEEMEGDHNLICDLPELFPQKTNLPENYTVLSPLIYSDHIRSNEITNRLDPAKRTIFVSMGSTGDWQGVSFLNDPGFTVYNIIAAGDKEKVLTAPHITRTDFINVHDVFPHTDLVICHGGNGTIYQSLLYGIPLLCKTAHFEQEWNVEAIARIGAGRSLDHVHGTDNHASIISEWVDLKRTGLYTDLSESIKESVQPIEQKMQELVYKIQSSETVPA